jgi:hypothetical protein
MANRQAASTSEEVREAEKAAKGREKQGDPKVWGPLLEVH